MIKHSWGDPHVVRTAKSLLKTLYITLGVFLVLFVIIHIAGVFYASSLAEKTTQDFESGIVKELADLKEQGDIAAKDPVLQEYLVAEDSEKLIALTKGMVSSGSIGMIGVTDANGTQLSRTKSVGRLGNSAFLTTPHGRAVDRNGSVQSVEISGFDPTQIILATGRRITKDGKVIGALFANTLLDDEYAVHFRDTYLPQGSEVVFYTKKFGIYGDSFRDPETRKLIDSYFNTGSVWIKDGNPENTISFKGGRFYLVRNHVFPGLEESPGGALIFVPRRDISNSLDLLASFLILLTFVFFAVRHHMSRRRGEERGWRYYVLLVSMSLPVFFLALLALHVENLGYLRLGRVPYVLYNSTLRFQPESGIYDKGFEQRFSIIVDTGDEAINAVQVSIPFDPKIVDVKSFDIENSACKYIIEKTIDLKLGVAKLSCAILKPEGERGSLTLADLIVMPRGVGTFDLKFDMKETRVLASDGLGTDVLREAQSGSYRVETFDPGLHADLGSISDKVSSTTRAFVLFSPSHPNQSKWYSSPEAYFVWLGHPGAVYKYEFNATPDTVPTGAHTVQSSSVTLPVIGDGIFYFHLQLASGGPVEHYKIQVDRTPPIITAVHLSSSKIVEGDVVRFSFEAEDRGSGVQKNYYVDLGNHLFLPIGDQLFIPFLESGDQKIVLRVYDVAGNYSEQSSVIHVEKQ